jgi:hypothetical protein
LPDDLAKFLVGNKSDLEASHEVGKEKALVFCQEFSINMLETMPSKKHGECLSWSRRRAEHKSC